MSFDFFVEPQDVPTVSSKHRKIHTQIPAPGTIQVLESLYKNESRSMHGQLPIVWDRAIDFNIFDIAGNKYIDFTSSIFIANVGHSNPAVTSSMQKCLDFNLYSCYVYANQVRSEYLERLVKFAGNGLDKAFLLSAGTESTEAVLKLMRMYGQKSKKRKLGIICIEGNWHGRTMGAQMMSSNINQKEWIGFQDPDIYYIPFPYPWLVSEEEGSSFFQTHISKLITSHSLDPSTDLCGVMLETFQGWGAVFYPKSFVKTFKEFCKDHNILLAFDEMQAGFGRTGKNFGFEHYEVLPDLVACGKAMGGGVPISGVIGRSELMDLPSVGNMSSTHSANPLSCSAALAVLDEIETKDLVSTSLNKGIHFKKRLKDIQDKFPEYISYVLGRGMIFAVLFKEPLTDLPFPSFASRVAQICMQKGLLVTHTGRESIKIGPPLTIPFEALYEALDVFEDSIQSAISQISNA